MINCCSQTQSTDTFTPLSISSYTTCVLLLSISSFCSNWKAGMERLDRSGNKFHFLNQPFGHGGTPLLSMRYYLCTLNFNTTACFSRAFLRDPCSIAKSDHTAGVLRPGFFLGKLSCQLFSKVFPTWTEVRLNLSTKE